MLSEMQGQKDFDITGNTLLGKRTAANRCKPRLTQTASEETASMSSLRMTSDKELMRKPRLRSLKKQIGDSNKKQDAQKNPNR